MLAFHETALLYLWLVDIAYKIVQIEIFIQVVD